MGSVLDELGAELETAKLRECEVELQAINRRLNQGMRLKRDEDTVEDAQAEREQGEIYGRVPNKISEPK
jgi:hypothetical protein